MPEPIVAPDHQDETTTLPRKRFTYWTEDGKRHWTPFLGVTWPESFEPVTADSRYACRSRSVLAGALKRRAKLIEDQCVTASRGLMPEPKAAALGGGTKIQIGPGNIMSAKTKSKKYTAYEKAGAARLNMILKLMTQTLPLIAKSKKQKRALLNAMVILGQYLNV
jgi:hypothetical protein